MALDGPARALGIGFLCGALLLPAAWGDPARGAVGGGGGGGVPVRGVAASGGVRRPGAGTVRAGGEGASFAEDGCRPRRLPVHRPGPPAIAVCPRRPAAPGAPLPRPLPEP